MKSGMPFWLSLLLALTDTAIITAVALDIVPRDPVLWAKLAVLAHVLILWLNTTLGNRLMVAVPTGQVIPMPPPFIVPSLQPPTGAPLAPPSSHVAIVADLPDGVKLPASSPDDPPKDAA